MKYKVQNTLFFGDGAKRSQIGRVECEKRINGRKGSNTDGASKGLVSFRRH